MVDAVMSITGIFGNLSVCCVILRFPGMRSATNYYLFSLAVADLLILLLGKSARWAFMYEVHTRGGEGQENAYQVGEVA